MRIGVPSYVLPGTWLENLRFLDSQRGIDAVELLFFSWDDEARAAFLPELGPIAAYAHRFRLSAHLPESFPRGLGELPSLLAPFVTTWIVHPPREPADLPGFVAGWRDFPFPGLALEYTHADRFYPCLDAFASAGLRPELCLDTGHLLRDGASPAEFARIHGAQIAHLHLHSCEAGKDHQALRPGEGWLAELIPFLRTFSGTVELELFDWKLIEASRAALSACGINGE